MNIRFLPFGLILFSSLSFADPKPIKGTSSLVVYQYEGGWSTSSLSVGGDVAKTMYEALQVDEIFDANRIEGRKVSKTFICVKTMKTGVVECHMFFTSFNTGVPQQYNMGDN